MPKINPIFWDPEYGPPLDPNTPIIDPWGPIMRTLPSRIPPQQAVNMMSIKPEGVSEMFGLKLWTILLIAAAIAYFMNK